MERPQSWNVLPWQRSDTLVIGILLLLAGAVRLHTLTEHSLWMDELRQVSYYQDDTGPRGVMYNAAAQAQPPLDYWIGWAIYQFSRSDAAVRGPAALFGTLLVLGTYMLARRLVNAPCAALAALAVACWPYGIHYSQEARPYAIFWCAAVFLQIALLRSWERNRWGDWVVFLMILGAFQITRGLAPLMITTALGCFAAAALVLTWRRQGWRVCLTHPSLRLLGCLVIVWSAFLPLLQLMIRANRRQGYLAENMAEVLHWAENLATLSHAAAAWFDMTLPFGLILIPVAIVGLVLALSRQVSPNRRTAWLMFAPIGLGFVIHVCVYTLYVAGTMPKPVYWAYVVPFALIAVACAMQAASWRLRQQGHPEHNLGLAWVTVALVLLLQLAVDRSNRIQHKPDWRGAARVALEALPDNGVVFYAVASPFGIYQPSCMFMPHYIPASRDVVELPAANQPGSPLRAAEGPCRSVLVLRCAQGSDITRIRDSLALDDEQFAVRALDGFVVVVDRSVRSNARVALENVVRRVLDSLGQDNPNSVQLRVSLATTLVDRGADSEARAELARARRLVRPAFRQRFDRDFAEVLDTAAAQVAPF